jgi:hypothetical protein
MLAVSSAFNLKIKALSICEKDTKGINKPIKGQCASYGILLNDYLFLLSSRITCFLGSTNSHSKEPVSNTIGETKTGTLKLFARSAILPNDMEKEILQSVQRNS